MNFSEERWVKLYTRDTTKWSLLSWQARGLFLLLIRKVNTSVNIHTGETGVRTISVVVGAQWAEIETPIRELISAGLVTHCEASARVSIPSFSSSQKAKQSGATRQRLSRERARETFGTEAECGNREMLRRLSGGQSGAHTYFIQSSRDDGLIKIGRSTCVQSRIASLSNGSADPLRLLAVIEGYVELVLHRKFAHLRRHGEWFAPHQDLLDFIREVSTNA